LSIAAIPGHLIENAGGLNLTRVAIVNTLEHATVEIPAGLGRIALIPFMPNLTDMLPLPWPNPLACDQSRAVNRTDVPVRPIAATRGQFDLLFEGIIEARLKSFPIPGPCGVLDTGLETRDARGVKQQAGVRRQLVDASLRCARPG
jgi:hypothetical protein